METDPLEKSPNFADSVASLGRETYAMLRAAMMRHRRVTSIADPIHRAKRRGGR